MSFRLRIALAGALAVAIAVAAASAATYVVVRDQLRGDVDEALTERGSAVFGRIGVDPGSGDTILDMPREPFGRAPIYIQLVPESGEPILPRNGRRDARVPLIARDRAVAAGDSGLFFRDATVSGTHLRVLTIPAVAGRGPRRGGIADGGTARYAVQLARSLEEVDATLARLRGWLLVVALGGIGLAGGLGLLVARTALAPVRRLTRTAEGVAETGDLTQRIDHGGRDELGRLAETFNTMLASLEESVRSQRQLVADASHELRTPLTSLRTNIDVLARAESLPPLERAGLLRDVSDQLKEMSVLVAELVELARGDSAAADPDDVRLDLVAADAIARALRDRPGLTIVPRLEQSMITAVRDAVDRAVSNLIDNAAKWSPPDAPIEVAVAEGEVTVRDHGPGIAEADLPFVFDRFYRATSARSLPGSGLGLAIVKQVADAHGGSVRAEAAPGGGTLMRLSFPATPLDANGHPDRIAAEQAAATLPAQSS